MVERETLIDKISKHPKIWLLVALAAAMLLIVSGIIGLLPGDKVNAAETENAPVRSRAEGIAVEMDEGSYFEKRNTFCRYLPTGVEYFYFVYTDDGAGVFVRADKNFGKDLEKQGSLAIKGVTANFSDDEKEFVNDSLAIDESKFIDLIWQKLFLLRILAGALLAVTAVLGVLLVKQVVSAEKKLYGVLNLIFCTLPFVSAGLVIYLVGYI